MHYISKLATSLLLQPPNNNEFTTLQIARLTDKKFCEVVFAVYVGRVTGMLVLYIKKLHISELISGFAITYYL